jgi:hypothetical protein
MLALPDFDLGAAHRYFAVDCFNQTWDFLQMPERSAEQDRHMLATCQASLFHWLGREDCTPGNLSVAYWQLSRVHAVLGSGTEALKAGEVCLAYAEGLDPFYVAYAYEALARAAGVCGDAGLAARYLESARELASQIQEKEDRDLLEADLSGLVPE